MKIPAILMTILAGCQLCACMPDRGPATRLPASGAKRVSEVPARPTSAGRPARPASLLVLGVN